MNSILRQASRPRAFGILTLLCLGGALPAAAGVITEATSYLVAPSGDYYQITYGYNDPSLVPTVGFGVYNSLNGTCEGTTCSGGGTGTTDTSGVLTASFDQTSASVVFPNPFSISNPVTISSSAYAVANLAAGTVGVAAQGNLYPFGPVGGGSGTAFALGSDSLTFTVTGAPTDIGVTYVVDGSESDPQGLFGNLAVTSRLTFGEAFSQAVVSWQNQIPGVGVGTAGGGWVSPCDSSVSACFSSLSPNDIAFEGTYALPVGVTTLPLILQLEGVCGLGDSCDYSHNGAVSLSLPSNVTYTSQSGVFLTATTPEPESIWLMVAGLAGFIAVRRLRPQR